MNKTIFKEKKYIHIDKLCNLSEVIPKIKDKNFILKHGFYPFLGNKIIFKKYSVEINEETQNHFKRKERPIKYASHIDSLIYQWYSYLLNKYYNNYALSRGFNTSSIAYRTCFPGKSSVDFAKEAIDFIKSTGSCYILVSDFSNFFNKIDHKILKENICRIMNISKLPADWFKIYKSMTKYCCLNKVDIEDYLIKNGFETKKTLNAKKKYKEKKDLNDNKCYFENIPWNDAKKDLKELIKNGINKDEYGIPQGASLSGIFANCFMIDFDEELYRYSMEHNGLYMRYSDDIIVIIPTGVGVTEKDIWNKICQCKDTLNNLEINKEKTSIYLYDDKKIMSLHENEKGFKKSPNRISYLGFTFDGENVKLRDKTIIKFYYKIYHKIDSMTSREKIRLKYNKKRKSKIDKHWILKKIYPSSHRNRFANYLAKAKKVFSNEKYIQDFDKNLKNKIFNRFNKKKVK